MKPLLLTIIPITVITAFQSTSYPIPTQLVDRSSQKEYTFICQDRKRSVHSFLSIRSYGISTSAVNAKISPSSIDLDSIEREAQESSENWDFSITPFLNTADANLLQNRLSNRGDIQHIQIGACGSSNPTRTRFVMTHPDLEFDATESEAQYCSLLRIENMNAADISSDRSSSRSKLWPRMLMNIGIDLQNVGDVIVDEIDSTVFMVVVPKVARQIIRLLPKEFRGLGITISELDMGESTVPYNGVSQDMELGTMDLRSLKYK